jgi:hypothetical protein
LVAAFVEAFVDFKKPNLSSTKAVRWEGLVVSSLFQQPFSGALNPALDRALSQQWADFDQVRD